MVPARAKGSAGGSNDRRSNDRRWQSPQPPDSNHSVGHPGDDVVQSALPLLLGQPARADVIGQPSCSTCPGCLASIKGGQSLSFRDRSPALEIPLSEAHISGNQYRPIIFSFLSSPLLQLTLTLPSEVPSVTADRWVLILFLAGAKQVTVLCT